MYEVVSSVRFRRVSIQMKLVASCEKQFIQKNATAEDYGRKQTELHAPGKKILVPILSFKQMNLGISNLSQNKVAKF